MKRSWFFIILLTFSSLALAGTAAYFSIFGLSKLFYGAGLGVIILATVLELSKLVTVSYVYRYWEIISKWFRFYLVSGVVIIMLITSLGIYGFLTSAYQKSSNKIELRDSQIKIAENKKSLFVAQLDRLNKSIETDDSRINKMSDIRNQQESRISNLYNNKSTSSARRTEGQISSTDEQIKAINQNITDKMKQTGSINDSISYYDQKILEYKTSDVTSEVGPLKYLSDLTGYPMNKVVNILVLLIIFVFDPMAISLLIAVNQLTMMDKKDKVDHKTDKIQIPKLKMPSFLKKKIKKSDNTENSFVDDSEILDEKKEEFSDIETVEISEEKPISVPEIVENKKFKELILELDPNDISDNMLIYHNVFGKGVVINSNIGKNRVLIKFEGYGIKEMNPIFSNLKEVRRIEESISVDEEDKNSLDNYEINENDLNVKLVDYDDMNKIEDTSGETYETVQYIDPETSWLVQQKVVKKS